MSNAPLSDEKREVGVVMEGVVDVPCDAERGDNEPCLPHSSLPNTSMLSVPSAALIVFHLQYSTSDGLLAALPLSSGLSL